MRKQDEDILLEHAKISSSALYKLQEDELKYELLPRQVVGQVAPQTIIVSPCLIPSLITRHADL